MQQLQAASVMPDPRPRVLCVEDDVEIALMLGEVLEDNGFSAAFVGSGAEMDGALRQDSYDLVLLDVMLPGEDGFSICQRLRRQSSIPIIVVTARGETVDRVIGLETGADDYITKPFNSRELVARIRALMRRVRGEPVPNRSRARSITFQGWRIDPATRELHDPTGLRIVLTSVEFDLLLAFCRHPGQVLSREQLMEIVHGGAVGSVERSIDVHISRIRQKLEPDSRQRAMIKTVRLGGYMFTPPVEEE
jgi:two-component system OmpR family response regulator